MGSYIQVNFSLIITVQQDTYTGDLTEHLPTVKLYKINIVQLLFYWEFQFDVLHYSRVYKFCIKFVHLRKPLNLLPPDVRF